MNEHDAIACLKKGNVVGLKTLVQTYQVQAVRAAYFITHDKSLAEEVVQDGFLRVFERIEQFDETRPFAPWFFRIITNLAIKEAQKENRAVSLNISTADPETTLLEQIPDELPKPEDEIAVQQLQETVRKALRNLTPQQRAVIVMRYFLDMSEAEMSHKLEIAPGTVKWHLHAARERLRALLTAG